MPAKNESEKTTDVSFYILLAMLGIALVTSVGYLIYSLFS